VISSTAEAAASALAESLGLTVDDVVVLQKSNKVTLRLLPCDVVARVAPPGDHVLGFEVELAQRLAAAGSPVATLVEPRVHARDGLTITLWTYHSSTGEVPPAEYAGALARLHAGLRNIDVPTPHFTDRVAEAQELVADPARTPALADADRELLSTTLRNMRQAVVERGAPEQLLHGEPHPGNVLATADGPLFIDLETCCRGPVEFDLAHAPGEVGEHYPGVDHDLIRDCRILVLAINTMWRWDVGDQLPGGLALAAEWLGQIRAALRA
jgi:hypothetical protein